MIPKLIKQVSEKDLNFGEVLFNTLAKKSIDVVEDVIADTINKSIDIHNPTDKDIEIILDKKDVIENRLNEHIKDDIKTFENSIIDEGLDFIEDKIEDYTGIGIDLKTGKATDDLIDARDMYQHIKHSEGESWFKRNFVEIFSIILLILSFGTLVGINFVDDSIIDKITKANIVSWIQNILMVLITFWLGSSYGSKDKTNIIKELKNQNKGS